jgi:hypothetical protein
MATQEKKVDEIGPAAHQVESYGEGITLKLDDKDNREFYGSSISDSYRLKSELVSKSLQEIGMGRSVPSLEVCTETSESLLFPCTRYQWELFVVTGFG